jgi:hypothetical protein
MARLPGTVAAVVALAALPIAAGAQTVGGDPPRGQAPRLVETTPPKPLEATPKPFEATPKPFEAFSRSALALRDSLVALARAQLGRRYVRGGASPRQGFDCSGLVQYIASLLHLSVPRTARRQALVGEPVPTDTAQLLPGDLLTFGRGKRISHVGIYVGNGRFIHASTKAGRVIESDLLRPLWPGVKPWRGARRLVPADTLIAAGPAADAPQPR